MYAAEKQLTPLSRVQLAGEEPKIISWIRAAQWEQAPGEKMRAKVPEFFGGVRLYRVQGQGGPAGSMGPLEVFIKKLQFNNVIGKQDLYPVSVQGNLRYLSLSKADLANLGVGSGSDEDDE